MMSTEPNSPFNAPNDNAAPGPIPTQPQNGAATTPQPVQQVEQGQPMTPPPINGTAPQSEQPNQLRTPNMPPMGYYSAPIPPSPHQFGQGFVVLGQWIKGFFSSSPFKMIDQAKTNINIWTGIILVVFALLFGSFGRMPLLFWRGFFFDFSVFSIISSYLLALLKNLILFALPYLLYLLFKGVKGSQLNGVQIFSVSVATILPMALAQILAIFLRLAPFLNSAVLLVGWLIHVALLRYATRGDHINQVKGFHWYIFAYAFVSAFFCI